MRRGVLLVCIVGLSAGLSACAAPPDTLSALPRQGKQAFAKDGAYAPQVGGEAPAPSGYLAFCERNPGECRARPGQPAVIALTDDVRATLKEINFVVNNAIRPVDDSDHYGMQEFWTVPVDGAGDCEDYVLAKRKMLTLLGMPAAALPSYLSGLVIGEELRSQHLHRLSDPIVIVGEPALADRYDLALRSLGIAARTAGSEATWCGLWTIAESLGRPS